MLEMLDHTIRNGSTPTFLYFDLYLYAHYVYTILGDSMLKHLNTTKMRRNLKDKLTIKTFPGAKVEEIMHYVQPSLAPISDHVVVHIGTNLAKKNKSTQLLVETISTFVQQIKTELPNAKFTISQVITRADQTDLTTKVSEINAAISNLCTENQCGTISHENIEHKHLNEFGLHLNRLGTTILAKNITSYLNNVS